MAQHDGREMELRDYLRVVSRRRMLLLLVVAVMVGGAVVGSLVQTPVYAAEAEVLLRRGPTESLFGTASGELVDPLRTLQTEIRVVTSYPVRLLATERLGFDAPIAARAAGQANVIILQAEDREPKKAADIAAAYAAAYIEFRRQQAVADVQSAAKEVQGKVDDLRKQVESAPAGLQPNLDQQLTLFRDKLNELQVNAALQTGGAQVVRPPTTPSSPDRPKPLRNGLIALTLGGFIGLGVIFLVDYLDDSVKTKEDLERAEPSLPVLSVIPAAARRKAKGEPTTVALSEPSSAAAEAYRTLRTAIQFPMLDRPARSLLITSPNADEGKTTTVANLGVVLARAGYRVVIVCCDLRRPRIHEFFGLPNSSGFTSVLLGKEPVSTALQPVQGVSGLQVLAAGPVPHNPSELLQLHRTAQLLRALESDGVFVLIDSPPVLPVTDALVLSKQVHGALLVCAAGKTRRRELHRARTMLVDMRAPLIGTVLNGVTDTRSYAYPYDDSEAAKGPNSNGGVGRRRAPQVRPGAEG